VRRMSTHSSKEQKEENKICTISPRFRIKQKAIYLIIQK
jgi:hypothetical protein